jgi:RNA polymerase sigma-70 factor (ECF subfamily)
MSGDPQRARELAHDAFVRAWERLSTFRGESGFDTWMHRLTVNVVLGARRSDRRREQRVSLAEDEPLAAIDAVAAPPVRDVVTRLDLDRAIASLQPGAREVFVLHDVEGYGHDEIARRMGMPAGTVRSTLHRARKALIKWMER